MGANVAIARHALAIDEQREDFEPTIWRPRPGVDLKQVWFAGVHGDIGGAYPSDKQTGLRAADVSLDWMVSEARQAGLIVEPHLKASLTDGKKAQLHKSRKHVFRLKAALHRSLQVDGIPTLVHPSVKLRYEQDPLYRPPQLEALVAAKGWAGLSVGY
jgi:hypothetical protein